MIDGANIYALSLVPPVLVSLLLAFQGLKTRYAERGRLFALLMFLIAAWSFFYGLELSATKESAMIFWLKLEYLFIPFVPMVMLFVVQQYAGLDTSLSRKQLFYLLPIPIFTMIFNFTNEFHGFYYKNISLNTEGAISLLNLEVGRWYYVHVIYSYLLIVAAAIILIKKLLYQRSLFRNQLIFMLIALLIPAISLSLYVFDLFPVENIDPTPFAFTFTGLAMSVSILHYRMLDLMPIAHEHVFRSMADGLVVIDLQSRIVEVNPESARIFKWNKMPYGEQAEAVWKAYPDLIKLLNRHTSDNLEMEVSTPDNSRYYLISNSLIKDYKEREVGLLLIIHDITIRYQMQEAIRQNEEKLRILNAEKDKLFSVIAHDLRGPLGSFTGLTEIILQQPGDIPADEMRQLMDGMNKSARSLQGLLENLLIWSRRQRDDVQISLASLCPDVFINDVLHLFQEAIASKMLNITTTIQQVKVMADEQMLLFVLRNLISNAIKFTAKGGSVHIETARHDDAFACVVVSDTGIGMNQELISKLFNIEAKVGRAGTDGEVSSGLGLILCKEFIERLNGKLIIESEPDKGSVFTMLLPLAND